MTSYTTKKGDRLYMDTDGYTAIKTHNGNTFSAYLVDGKFTDTTPLGRRILENAYREYQQSQQELDTMIAEQGGDK